MSRRLPKVSPWAERFIEPEPVGIEVEPSSIRLKPNLMERVATAQSEARERARTGMRNAWINGLSGWGCMLLSFFNWPVVSTILFWGAVLFWALAFFQWMEFVVERKASRMYPDPEDLARQ